MRNLVMRVVIAALALAGLIVSARALEVHNMDPGLAPPCTVTEKWDCGAVNHSRYSYFPAKSFDEASGTKHVPVAAVGIAGYAVMLLLAGFGFFRVLLPVALGGLGVACYLSYLEKFVIEKWCIYCVWSQTIVTAIVLATIVALILRRRTGYGRHALSSAPEMARQA